MSDGDELRSTEVRPPVIETESMPNAASRWRRPLPQVSPTVVAYATAVGLFVLGAFLQPGYLAPGHVSTVVTLSAILGIVAAGQTVVIISAGIDLSVGALVTFTEVMTIAWAGGSDS